MDKDPVFGKKKQNQRIGHCGASSGFFQKKSLKTCGFYERTGKESAVSFMARYLDSFKSSENCDHISELGI